MAPRLFHSRGASAGRRRRWSFHAQAWDIIRLRLGAGELRPREYYDFELYDSRPLADKRRFIGGRRARRLYHHLNKLTWQSVTDDKLLFYSLLASLGLPFPRSMRSTIR
jgi:hypothetical protein